MRTLRDFFPDASVKFLQSAALKEQWPESDCVEFALLGRSNVGKSSFINHIFESKGVAKVSKQPGKTRLINFFSLNKEITFVDLPGYGYAKLSHKERDFLGDMLRQFCRERENLAGIIWLLDYRRDKGTDLDREAAQWLAEIGIPVFVVLTKEDKLNLKEQGRNLKSIKNAYQFDSGIPLLRYSTAKEIYRERFWEKFLNWITPKEDVS
jgi:GTP-binding protein